MSFIVLPKLKIACVYAHIYTWKDILFQIIFQKRTRISKYFKNKIFLEKISYESCKMARKT